MQARTISREADVSSDGRTVWVNDSSGACIGRFRHGLMDVHCSVEDMMKGKHCLDCRQGDEATFAAFVESMAKHHNVVVDPCHEPTMPRLPQR